MEILDNKRRTESSLRWILAAACLAIAAPCFAQQTKFVVTGPVFQTLKPNSGIVPATFTVSASNGAVVPFKASSSNGALSISFSACSGGQPSVIFGTPATLVACIDTQKLVRGKYVFLLTITSQQAKGFGGMMAAAVPNAAATDCTTSATVTVPEIHVAVNVTVAGSGTTISTDTPKASLSYSADGKSDLLQQKITISYGDPSTSDAINTIEFVPVSPPEGSWMNLTTDCSGQSLMTNTCMLTVSANPFKLIGAVVGQTFTSTVPITSDTGSRADLVVSLDYSRTSVSQLFPHLADGGEWRTEFLLTNPTLNPVCVDLKFHLDGGAAVLPIVDDGQGNGNITATGIGNINLTASGSRRFLTKGPSASNFVSGWVEIVSQVQIGGQAKFTRHASDGNYYQASVAVTLPVASFALPYDSTLDSLTRDTRVTGLAIANPDSKQNVKFTCTDGVGVNAPSVTFTNLSQNQLNAFGHFGQVLNNLTGSGTLSCKSTAVDAAGTAILDGLGHEIPQSVGVLGLSFLGPYSFSSVPII